MISALVLAPGFFQTVGYGAGEALAFAIVLAPLIIMGLVFRNFTAKYRNAWTSLHENIPLAKLPVSSDQEILPEIQGSRDLRILQIARNLCQKLNITNVQLGAVAWQDYQPKSGKGPFSSGSVMIPFDGCIIKRDTIILPTVTQDKLSPEEWEPLLASELIYARELRSKRVRGLLLRILPATIIYLLIPVVLWQLGILNLQGETTERGAPIPVVVAFFQIYSGTALIFASVLYILLGLRYTRKLRMFADRETVGIVGKQVFVSALQEIGRAFPDIMIGKRPSLEYPPGRLSIKNRIDNVQSQ
jgi:hypothetical protein